MTSGEPTDQAHDGEAGLRQAARARTAAPAGAAPRRSGPARASTSPRSGRAEEGGVADQERGHQLHDRRAHRGRRYDDADLRLDYGSAKSSSSSSTDGRPASNATDDDSTTPTPPPTEPRTRAADGNADEARRTVAEAPVDEASPRRIEAASRRPPRTSPTPSSRSTSRTSRRRGARGREPSPYDRPGRWYVVHTYAGYENKVKSNLRAACAR